jgi:hypothetical protein
MQKINNIIKKIEAEGYEEDPVNEVIKLEVGEFVEIELLDIQPFERNGKTKNRFIVKDLSDGVEKTLFSTVQMDQLLSKKEIGDVFKLLRIEDKDIGKPNPMAQYRTFSKKE